MKKIAMLTDGWKRLLVYAWVYGMMKRAEETDEAICLHHFNCFGNWSTDEKNNQGEYNIFNLPDLSAYDAIVADFSNIRDEKQLKHLTALLTASQKPVVSINYDAEDFYYAGIDNKEPIRQMMYHLYRKHNCRCFLFAGGPKDNYENTRRAETYIETLQELGLCEEDNPLWYGDYDYETGVNYMKRLHSLNCPMPQAIVCANDNIAVGISTEAMKLGYHIPEDFCITGLDNLDKAAYFQPQITTAGYRREEIGRKCLDILLEVWNGKKPDKYSLIKPQCFFSESCGCPRSNVPLCIREGDYRAYMKNQVMSGIRKDKEDQKLMDLETDLARCVSFDELFRKIGNFMEGYDCDGFFIVADRRLYLAENETAFAVTGYDREKLQVVCARDFHREISIETTEELALYMEQYGTMSEFLFTPIHFKEQTIGYSVLKNGRFLYENPGFYSIHSIFVREMEVLFGKQQLKRINRKLQDLYNRDQLTGLYNRIAYNERMEPEFEAYDKAGASCSVLFADIDDFKKINDTFGHKYGDEVIRRVAQLIRQNCPEGSFCFRYGGDEFVMILPRTDRAVGERLKAEIKRQAAEMNTGISIGIVQTVPGSGRLLQSWVEEADQNMYREKMLNAAEQMA